jgi:hypothetical protein
MLFIAGFLSVMTFGSFLWTVIQIVKPEWFYRAENEANLKRKRPWWYLLLGVAGLLILIALWIQAFKLELVSVWILCLVFSLGSIKALGMVFFYDKFSGGVTKLVGKMQSSKRTYATIVISRGALTICLLLASLYFGGIFGAVK